MGAVWMRARAELRASMRASIGLGLMIALAGAVVMAAAAGARRTEAAYPEFRRAQNTAQLSIANNEDVPFGFAAVDLDAIARFPEVTDSAMFSAFVAFARTEDGLEITPIADRNPVVFFGSDDGKFDRVLNRMHILEGRLPDPEVAEELAVSYVASREYGIRIGSRLTLLLPTFADLEKAFEGGNPRPSGPTVQARVVAIEATSEELPPGLGYPPIHVTPAFFRMYESVVPHFPGTIYKLRSDDDFEAAVARVQEEAVRPTPANPSTRIQVFDELLNARAIMRGVHLEVLALWLLAGLASITSILVLSQAVFRQATTDAGSHDALRAIGMSRAQLGSATALRLGMVAAAGAAMACASAIGLSPLMPIGLSRLVDLHPGIALDPLVLGVGSAVTVSTAAVTAALAGARGPSRAARDESARASKIVRLFSRANMPPTAVAGARMALQAGRGRSAAPVRSTMVGVVVAIAAVVSGFGFAASMQHLIHTPRLLGWNWSGSIGDDFDPDGTATVVPALRGIPGIASFTGGGTGRVKIGEVSFDVLGQDQMLGRLGPLLLAGREPEGTDEIVLGTRTMRATGAGIGDLVTVRTGDITQQMRVVGRAVVPPLVPQDAAGVGGWMTFEALRRLQVDVARDIFLFRVAAGEDEAATFNAVRQALPGLALTTEPVYGDQNNLKNIINLPVILAGLLALFGLASLTHTLLQAIRRGRRDLAILKAIGFSRRQVHGVVRWHASTLMVLALAIGLPLGIGAARWSWGVYADAGGFAFEPALPLLAVALLVPAALVIGNLIAAIPGASAARTKPALVLRTE